MSNENIKCQRCKSTDITIHMTLGLSYYHCLKCNFENICNRCSSSNIEVDEEGYTCKNCNHEVYW